MHRVAKYIEGIHCEMNPSATATGTIMVSGRAGGCTNMQLL